MSALSGGALLALTALALLVAPAKAAEPRDALRPGPNALYAVRWHKGNITQIVCRNGAYFTLRFSPSRKRYFVQELYEVSGKSIPEAAGKACER